jgi:hypothetical protein
VGRLHRILRLGCRYLSSSELMAAQSRAAVSLFILKGE